MQIQNTTDRNGQTTLLRKTSEVTDQRMRAIAYSMDALVPGFYIWLGPVKIRVGGSEPEENYPGVINSLAGIAVVLPGYRIFSTYNGCYDPS